MFEVSAVLTSILRGLGCFFGMRPYELDLLELAENAAPCHQREDEHSSTTLFGNEAIGSDYLDYNPTTGYPMFGGIDAGGYTMGDHVSR